MVPHLTTALTGPLLELERNFLDRRGYIEQWFRSQWQDTTPPFCGSTDLRNSGFKLAPVDLNLFPGGFIHLSNAFMPLCVPAAQAAVERICPDAPPNRFYAYGVVARLALLAAALEIEQTAPAMLDAAVA